MLVRHSASRWCRWLCHSLGPDILQELVAVLPGVGLAEYLAYLFQTESFGLNHEEVDDQDLESIPDGEDNVNCGGT